MSHESAYKTVHGGDPRSAAGVVSARALGHAASLWKILFYSSAYLSVITMVEVGIVMAVLAIPWNVAPLIGGLVTFAVYANDRIADAEDDAVSKPGQTEWVTRHESHLYLLAAVAYGVGVALAVLGGPVAFGLTLLPGAAWVLYAADWAPAFASRVRRLKEVLVVNSAVVALAWAISVTALPAAFAGRSPSPVLALVFAYFLLRSFVDVELPNVRDLDSDAVAGVRTLPVVLGEAATRRVVVAIDALTMALISGGVWAGLLAWPVAAALGVGLAYSAVTTVALDWRSDGDWLTVVPELEYLVVGVGLLAVFVS